MSPVAVVTIVHGRHDHLRGQLWGLRRQVRSPDLHVVVAMDDPEVGGVVAAHAAPDRAAVVVPVAAPGGRLPLARARNAGVAVARERGAGVVVLLDVDCVPSPDLVRRYVDVVGTQQALAGDRPVVVCGGVRYLDEPTTLLGPAGWTWGRLERGSTPHPGRPLPGPGVSVEADLRRFWSLSFATTTRSWERIGGFDETYVGYGGEDTDFGQRLGAADGLLLSTGGAVALHQHHESHSPPLAHVTDVVDNANRFAERWGWWPMTGWLDAFEDLGLVRREPSGRFRVTTRAVRLERERTGRPSDRSSTAPSPQAGSGGGVA